MTFASIVVPAFNVQETLAETLRALLAQTYPDFEIIVVDDGSSDDTPQIARSFESDPRLRVIRQANRGLAGARNTGIAAARGEVIGFCDADDLWVPAKLATHMAHLNAHPEVGISYSGSALIDDNGERMGQSQRPRLKDVDAAVIFKRNPIGNGSAVVLRREVFESIAYRPRHETERDWYFDETFRQSEDIECWLRIALSTDWVFEGVPGLLTHYRINAGGLSAATDRQLAAWERMVVKLTPLNPAFFSVNTHAARAYQLRYLSRRAISDLDPKRAVLLSRAWLRESRAPLIEEPIKSGVTLAATMVLVVMGGAAIRRAMGLIARRASSGQAT
ncbi:glycosyltransferase family 2 protein [Marivita geojedonensis]|uniref:Glucosyl transferase n=1 Tax=Marivita geojedonensis TaxID=1123756 RepID=A0A1X4NI07_9RHOB|nr:glycosyltransferase family A protein [Marivita geojedonensis]OSQ47607.1 glucosyl transferase [Marivita geojedonensis]PRY74599.1 glycosyl transferase family 2 [Marivita geojedonensis]